MFAIFIRMRFMNIEFFVEKDLQCKLFAGSEVFLNISYQPDTAYFSSKFTQTLRIRNRSEYLF